MDEGEYSTRCVWGWGGAEKCARKGSKMMSKLPPYMEELVIHGGVHVLRDEVRGPALHRVRLEGRVRLGGRPTPTCACVRARTDAGEERMPGRDPAY